MNTGRSTMIENIEAASRAKEFCWLSDRQILGLIDGSENNLELDLLVAALRWGDENPVELPEIISHIRAELISLSDFNENSIVKLHPKEVKNIRMKIEKYNENVFAQPLFQSDHSQIRGSNLSY